MTALPLTPLDPRGAAVPGPPPAPAAPPAAVAAFGEHLALLERYAALLAGPGVVRGLIGPRETARLWERHLLNCSALGELIAPGETVLDLGSGAGLPGLVLAATRPDLAVVLVEPLLRRASFLQEAVQELGLRTTVVRRTRAEQLVGEVVVDTVVARAVAPLDRLAGWALALLRPGGRLLALKGEQAAVELAAAGPALHRAGASGAEVIEVGSPGEATFARVVAVTRGPAAASARRPGPAGGRRTGHGPGRPRERR